MSSALTLTEGQGDPVPVTDFIAHDDVCQATMPYLLPYIVYESLSLRRTTRGSDADAKICLPRILTVLDTGYNIRGFGTVTVLTCSSHYILSYSSCLRLNKNFMSRARDDFLGNVTDITTDHVGPLERMENCVLKVWDRLVRIPFIDLRRDLHHPNRFEDSTVPMI